MAKRLAPINNASRQWVFTLNNYTTSDEAECIATAADPRCLAAVCGRERGELDTPHIQGFFRFDGPRTFNVMKRMFGGRAHWESARAAQRSEEYCRKDGNMIIDKTTELQQGKRTDLAEACKVVDAGGLPLLKEKFPDLLVKYPGGFKLYVSIGVPSPHRPQLRVVVYYGPTGTGKSRAAQILTPNFAPTLPPDNKQPPWYDGYASEPHLILDEFAGQLPFRHFLRLLDVYPLNLPIKGGFTPAHYTKLTITSNFHPQEWYPQEDYAPVARRIHGIYNNPPWDYETLPY